MTIDLENILETEGLDAALRALDKHTARGLVRKFKCDIAERVLHIYEKRYPDNKAPRRAIEVGRLFADGKATNEELIAAYKANIDAVRDAAAAGYAHAHTAAIAARHAVSIFTDGAAHAADFARRASANYNEELVYQTELFRKTFCEVKTMTEDAEKEKISAEQNYQKYFDNLVVKSLTENGIPKCHAKKVIDLISDGKIKSIQKVY